MLPIYAPLENIEADFDRIQQEVLNIPNTFFYDQTVWRKQAGTYDTISGNQIGSNEDNELSDYFTVDQNGINNFHSGVKKNWRCVRLTEVPGEPYSLTQNTIKRNGEWIRFRQKYPNWTWRIELEKYIPYTLTCIKSLPVDIYNVVRVLILNPGCFGPIHVDEGSKDFYSENVTSINFNIASGGQPLKMFIGDNKVDINDKVYLINNGYPHGVETVSSQRITITVECYVSQNIKDFINFDRAIWN